MKNHFSFLKLIVASSIVAFSLNPTSPAQEKPVPRDKQALTIPTSDNIVTLSITLSDGTPITASELEGGLIRIEKEGKVIGIVPHIVDRDRGNISVEIFRMTRIKKGENILGESIEQVETFDLYGSAAKQSNVDLQPSITFKNIRKASSDHHTIPDTSTVLNNPGGGDRCCITCGSTTVCACAVVLSCGSCCCGGCCN